MKDSELIKLLNAHCVTLKRVGHSHDLYFSPITGNTFPVPRHASQEIHTGTLEAILRQAGIERSAAHA